MCVDVPGPYKVCGHKLPQITTLFLSSLPQAHSILIPDDTFLKESESTLST